MSQDIHVFTSVEEAINLLKNYNIQIQKQDLPKEKIINESVWSSVFRAFYNLDKKPSDIYRKWAEANFDEILQKLNQITIKEEYDKQLSLWIDSLIDYWNSQVDINSQKIMFGPASKMVNLLIKWVNESTFLNNKAIIPFMNIPLDSFTLVPLTKIINDLTEVNYKINIPKNATMQFVNTPDLYLIIQKAIFKLCKEANIHPIIYEYWCWDEKHSL